MVVHELPAHEAPMNLLLLADPDEERVRSYLPECRAFVLGAPPAGVLLLRSSDGGVCEIMNIAVDPFRSRTGLGSKLVSHAIAEARVSGAQRIQVGTGNSSVGPLSFYQKLGFRVVGVLRGYFDTYVPPIVENGVLCRDMIRLELCL